MVPVALALLHMDSAIVAVVTELEVVFAALFGLFFFREALGAKQILGFLLAFLGIFVIYKSTEVPKEKFWAMGLVLITALSYGLASNQVKLYHWIDPITLTVWSALMAAPQVLLCSLLVEGKELAKLGEMSLDTFLALVFSALFSYVGFIIWNYLLRIYRVNQVAPFGMLIPIATLASSYVLLGETTDSTALWGGALTILGVWVQLKGTPQRSTLPS